MTNILNTVLRVLLTGVISCCFLVLGTFALLIVIFAFTTFTVGAIFAVIPVSWAVAEEFSEMWTGW
jgi:hypothetical protein